MKDVLFISSRLEKNKENISSYRNLINLKEIFSQVDTYLINKKSDLEKAINIIFLNRLENSSIKAEKDILKLIKKNKYSYVFLDNSGFGYLVEKIKINFPNTKILVYCHDINYHLFNSLYEEYKKNIEGIYDILKLFILKKEIYNAKKNEIKTFKNADKVITINSRDTQKLKEIYKLNENEELGITFEKYKGKDNNFKNQKFKLLFIGAASLKSNVTGIKFFIEEVLKELDCELIILGRGMEKNKKIFEKNSSKVRVIGEVTDLDKYYINCDAVVVPIFSGGGMKGKTGEALSYGKTIFGTTEAFQGYELDFEKVGGLCNSKEEFVEKISLYIEKWKNNEVKNENKYSKNIFNKYYTYEVSKKKLKEIFKGV